jgi:hypothetical protein
MFEHAAAWVFFVGEMLAEWIRMHAMNTHKKSRTIFCKANKGRAACTGPAHVFVPLHDQGVWRCMACLRRVRSLSASAAHTPCKEFANRIRDVVLAEHGHSLATATIGDLGFMVLCTKCGAWTTEKPRLLLAPCRRVPSVNMANDLATIHRGLHPKDRKTVLGPVLQIGSGN